MIPVEVDYDRPHNNHWDDFLYMRGRTDQNCSCTYTKNNDIIHSLKPEGKVFVGRSTGYHSSFSKKLVGNHRGSWKLVILVRVCKVL